MIMNWKVTTQGRQCRIDLETDRVHLRFSLAQRGGKPYVTAVRTPDSEPGGPSR
jgi:hypothetical protein